MGIRSKQRAPQVTRRKMVLAVAIPLGIAAVIFGLAARSAPAAGEGEAAARIEANRLEPVAAELRELGAGLRSNGGIHRVTLPHDLAMAISPTEAREIALGLRRRMGGMVKILSPAGQVLAEAP